MIVYKLVKIEVLFWQDKHPVLILFKSKKTDRNPVSVIVDGRRIDAKYLNPYTYSFVPSGRFPGIHTHTHSVDVKVLYLSSFFLNSQWNKLNNNIYTSSGMISSEFESEE